MFLATFLFGVLLSFPRICNATKAAPVLDPDNGRHITTGVITRAGGGHPYLRRDINDLKKNHPETWTLFLLGLTALQQMDQNDPLSYYRIAGIHGRPHVPWQDANGTEHAGGSGYCPHNNIMFTVWHRPYVSLFEQELFKQVKKIADNYTVDQHRWRMAADAFRIPYWDWALGQQGDEFPDIFTTSLATVTGPDGKPLTIANPLYQYRFHPTSSQDFASPWDQMNTTLRCPTSHESDAQSQQQIVRTNFMKYRRGVHDGVAKAFNSSTYNEFATELEVHHGTIHFLAGCVDPYAGHFWDSEYSAFDPIFMLVHANADRLMAMYQAAHPNTWLEPKGSESTGNFWIPNYIELNADLQMQPFWKDGISFYTPNDVRNITALGYAYPETQYWLYPTTEYWRMAVNSSIALHYSPSARGILTELNEKGGSSASHLLKDSTFIDWTIKMRALVADLPSTFYVSFSLSGSSSSDDSYEVGTWTRQVTGRHSTRDRDDLKKSPTGNLEDAAYDYLENSIHLTSSLLDQITAGKLKSLEASDVVPYLKKHLVWHVNGGNNSHNDHPDSISVEVSSTKVYIPDDPAHALEYGGDSTAYPEITNRQ